MTCRWLILIACVAACLPALADEQTPASPAPNVATPAAQADRPHSSTNRLDGEIHDSVDRFVIRPVPDREGDLPACFVRADYLRKHNDAILATSYLREIVTNGDLLPQYRARAILELADCLDQQHESAEALCWLKIWMELYPSRPEIGAVAYRIGALYTQMGLPDQARDAFYLTLAHSVNDGQVKNPQDLKLYTRLTTGTLWGLAANEYQSGHWARAAELFQRYGQEAQAATPVSLERAAFLEADCYYQSQQLDHALGLYEDTIQKHPFNPLAPQARVRLYHLYVLKKQPEKAQQELEALAWTVRTVWPGDEAYWQKQTGELLLALNKNNADVLPPLLQRASELPPEGKPWQEAIEHYDTLVSYEARPTQASMDHSVSPAGIANLRHGLAEDDALRSMSHTLDQLLPAASPVSTP